MRMCSLFLQQEISQGTMAVKWGMHWGTLIQGQMVINIPKYIHGKGMLLDPSWAVSLKGKTSLVLSETHQCEISLFGRLPYQLRRWSLIVCVVYYTTPWCNIVLQPPVFFLLPFCVPPPPATGSYHSPCTPKHLRGWKRSIFLKYQLSPDKDRLDL